MLEGAQWQIEKNGQRNLIQPVDIGILVRTTREGQSIRAQLSRRNIPAVLIAEEKILQSAEALQLLYTLQAIASNRIEDIRRALLLGFNGLSLKT